MSTESKSGASGAELAALDNGLWGIQSHYVHYFLLRCGSGFLTIVSARY